MTGYKLTYFDFPGGRGEECRLALILNGVDFEDHRIKFEDWPALKPDTPFGGLPVLEIEGRPPLAQSSAILTFIGRTHGLHPKDPWDAARHEAIFAAVEAYRCAASHTSDTKEEAEKRARREAMATEFLPRWFQHLERQITGPFVEGEAMHLADIKIFHVVNALASGSIDYIDPSVLDPFPKLVALKEAVLAHPQVTAHRTG